MRELDQVYAPIGEWVPWRDGYSVDSLATRLANLEAWAVKMAVLIEKLNEEYEKQWKPE